MAGSTLSFRNLIDLIEAAAQPWAVEPSPYFEESVRAMTRVFPDLRERVKKFIDVKLANPLSARYGKHDLPMTGALVGFWHCHLRDDAILIYNLVNRKIHLIIVVPHAEIEGKQARRLGKRLEPFNSQRRLR